MKIQTSTAPQTVLLETPPEDFDSQVFTDTDSALSLPLLAAEKPEHLTNSPLPPIPEGVSTFIRWAQNASRHDHTQNENAFRTYDQLILKLSQIVSTCPILFKFLSDNARSHLDEAINLPDLLIRIQANPKGYLKSPLITEVQEATYRYRPYLEEMDGMIECLESALTTRGTFSHFPGNLANKKQIEETLTSLRIVLDGAFRIISEIVPANIPLVITIAKNFAGRGLSNEDLVQEGTLGVLKAAQRFEVERGNKFSTYSSWWIRQCLKRAVADDARDIRIPVNMADFIYIVGNVERKLEQQNGYPPSSLEIAKEIKANQERKRSSENKDIKSDAGIDLDTLTDRVRNALLYRCTMVSLQSPLQTPEGNDAVLAEIIPDENAEDPSIAALEKNEAGSVLEILKSLSPREQIVITLRFGLDGHDEHTLEAIGEKFKLTRERIRQIESKALEKMGRKVTRLNRISTD